MNAELVVGAIAGVGALAVIVIPVLFAIFTTLRSIQRDIGGLHKDIGGLHKDIGGLHRDIGDLRERMARLEGLFEGFTGRTDKQTT